MHPFDLGGAYADFMMDDEGDARLKASYGDNYVTLGCIEAEIRPGQPFRVNQNFGPAA